MTLQEKTTLDSPYYLMELRDDEKLNYHYIILPEDESENKARYNQFSIVDNTDPDPLQGEVKLTPGDYHYKVYEQVSSTNLDPDGLTIVEIGRAYCPRTDQEKVVFENSPTAVVYGG